MNFRYPAISRHISPYPAISRHIPLRDVAGSVENWRGRLWGGTSAKERRKKIRQKAEHMHNNEYAIKEKYDDITSFQKIRTVDFLLDEVARLIIELNNEFCKSRVDVPDEELM